MYLIVQKYMLSHVTIIVRMFQYLGLGYILEARYVAYREMNVRGAASHRELRRHAAGSYNYRMHVQMP